MINEMNYLVLYKLLIINMKNIVSIVGFMLLCNLSFCQHSNIDYSLAKTNTKIAGIYIFIKCEPVNAYTVLKTVKVKLDLSKDLDKPLEKVIKRSLKKFSNLDAVIIRANSYHRADLIIFNKTE